MGPTLRSGWLTRKKQAGKFQNDVVEGRDPSAERADSKKAQRTGDTVEQLARAAFKATKLGLHGGRKKPKRPSTLANETRLYEHHIAPKLGEKIYTELRRRDVKEFMRNLAADSGLAASSVGRVGELLSGIFAFAVHEDLLEANPVTGLCHPLAYKSRTRRFSDASLKLLWDTLVLHSEPRTPGEANAIDPISRLDPITCLAAGLMLITLSRRTETCGARWDETDRAALKWTVPGERSKSGRTEIKPLSAEALAIMDAAAA